jgi:hypothetical protein
MISDFRCPSETSVKRCLNVTSDHRSENRAPRVLLLYYTYTGQERRVLETAGEVFRGRGCEVQQAEIEFTDPRFAEPFSRFPMRHVVLDFLAMLPYQLRRATGEIERQTKRETVTTT